VKKKKDT